MENVEELCIRVCISFFFLFMQNQVSQTITETFFSVGKNRSEIFEFWSNFELIRGPSRRTIAYLSLISGVKT